MNSHFALLLFQEMLRKDQRMQIGTKRAEKPVGISWAACNSGPKLPRAVCLGEEKTIC